jgi:hypothetical protein
MNHDTFGVQKSDVYQKPAQSEMSRRRLRNRPLLLSSRRYHETKRCDRDETRE